MRIRVKICGVTDRAGVAVAVGAGADCVGFVFAESERRVTPEVATAIAEELPDGIRRVAVFRHPSPREVQEVMALFRADLIQCEPGPPPTSEGAGAPGDSTRLTAPHLPVFHDSEDLVERIRAYRTGNAQGLILLEGVGRGGRGTKADWGRAEEAARLGPLALAGGLTPENVADAIRRVRPYAVDVSSGVESAPGVKDPSKIHDFVHAVREVESEVSDAADRESTPR